MFLSSELRFKNCFPTPHTSHQDLDCPDRNSFHKYALAIPHSCSHSIIMACLPISYPIWLTTMKSNYSISFQMHLEHEETGFFNFLIEMFKKGGLLDCLDKMQDVKTANYPVLCSFPHHNYINYLPGLETPILILKELFFKSMCKKMKEMLSDNCPEESSMHPSRAVQGLWPIWICTANIPGTGTILTHPN